VQIGLVSTDQRLIDELTNVVYAKPFGWRIFADANDLQPKSLEPSYSHVILSDRDLSYGELEEFLEGMQGQEPTTKIIVLLSNYHDASINEKYVKMCKLMKLDYILPGRSTAVIADEIRAWVDGANGGQSSLALSGKLITFVGSTPNIGTTLASYGVACLLAMETSKKVGYLCLNLKSSKLHRYLGREEHPFTLDGLRAELKAQSLTPERLLHVCDKPKEAHGLHVLYGNMLREQAEFFTPSEIIHLLRVARGAFDICIIEVSAYWDNAATVSGLLEADSKIVVTTGDIAHFQEDFSRWIRQVGSVFGLQPDAFELMAVQTDRHAKQSEFTIRDIRKETQLHLIGHVSRHGDALARCNQGKLMELLSPAHPMHHEVKAVARKFADFYKLPQKTSMRQETWFQKLIAGKRAVS
jgi:MinD-like ATPase involved in chromosome partitioning or flagellar assembly